MQTTHNIFEGSGAVFPHMSESAEIVELNGHLIDSMILAKVMDKVVNRGGKYEFLEFRVGKGVEDTSYAKLRIMGDDGDHLRDILDDIHADGATEISPQPVAVRKAPRDMVLPVDFYSTTNNETRIFHDGRWITVQKQMMDKCIVVGRDGAWCTPIRDVRKGDEIVCGEDGVQVIPPPRPRGGANIFEFMGSSGVVQQHPQTAHKQAKMCPQVPRQRLFSPRWAALGHVLAYPDA